MVQDAETKKMSEAHSLAVAGRVQDCLGCEESGNHVGEFKTGQDLKKSKQVSGIHLLGGVEIWNGQEIEREQVSKGHKWDTLATLTLVRTTNDCVTNNE
jgi:hypothetical protein